MSYIVGIMGNIAGALSYTRLFNVDGEFVITLDGFGRCMV